MNDGGSAFPSIKSDWIGQGYSDREGMTLRDYFAGQALAGLIAQTDRALSCKIFASEAYKCADALIAERQKERDA